MRPDAVLHSRKGDRAYARYLVRQAAAIEGGMGLLAKRMDIAIRTIQMWITEQEEWTPMPYLAQYAMEAIVEAFEANNEDVP